MISKSMRASKYADMDQLGIAPQCGFASTEEGNAISVDDQRRKLELVVRCAEDLCRIEWSDRSITPVILSMSDQMIDLSD